MREVSLDTIADTYVDDGLTEYSAWSPALQTTWNFGIHLYGLDEVRILRVQERLYRIYERQALFVRFILFEIEFDEFVRLTKMKCYYCGVEPLQSFYGYMYNGLDRIDNNEGYIEGNIISCCGHCNTMKGELSKIEFVEHCKHITSYYDLENRTIPKPIHESNDYYEPTTKRKNRLAFGEAATNFIYYSYQTRAKKYDLDFTLDRESFVRITQKSCWYCGVEPSNRGHLVGYYGDFIYNGIDRINSSKGYVDGNIVPCCGKCNTMKTNMNVLTFTKQAMKIANYRW